LPVSPELLQGAIDRLFQYINDTASAPHVRTAVSDLEFEASHPFKDGTGRIGRVLIPLMLWQLGLIAEPHFCISNFFEEHRHAYIDKIRAVSASGAWLEWITFFLNALEVEAQSNLSKAAKMRDLYEDMTGRFRHALASQ
jgi:Fic family protein